jgi:predicted transcriptional regulator of viral defense system
VIVEKITLSGIKASEPQSSLLEDIPYLNKATLATIIGRQGEALNYWVKRLVQTGVIIPLKRGLFISKTFLLKIKGQPILLDKYREYLAGVLRSPSYISLEYALAKHGIITDVPYAITAITIKSSRTFTNDLGTFIFRSVKERLFCGYKEILFKDKRYYIATPAKALFDLVYLRKFVKQEMEQELEEGLRINWETFTKDDLKELEKFVELSDKRKMEKFLSIIIRRELI